MRCETASVPIRGSKFVGIDSTRKLTTPGSVLTVREQDESESRRRREVKDVKEAKEVKEKTPHPELRPRLSEGCVPLLPLNPKPPLLPPLTCIAHLTQHDCLFRSRRARHVRGPFVQRFMREHGKSKRFLRVSRQAKIIGRPHT